jgi:hypothetical protein
MGQPIEEGLEEEEAEEEEAEEEEEEGEREREWGGREREREMLPKRGKLKTRLPQCLPTRR